ncbi:hypothetical protein FOMPIDRAFT_1111278, partial [Fomitopsis schrenkii]
MHYDNPSSELQWDYGLYLIDRILMANGKRLTNFPPMPLPQQPWEDVADNPLLQEQLNYDRPALLLEVAEHEDLFNTEQTHAFTKVMESVDQNQGRLFFLHSAGGCGKTFVCNTVAAAVRARGQACLCVASSGIASLLLDGGRTAHSRFKIPIPVFTDSTCRINRGSDLQKLLEQTGCII